MAFRLKLFFLSLIISFSLFSQLRHREALGGARAVTAFTNIFIFLLPWFPINFIYSAENLDMQILLRQFCYHHHIRTYHHLRENKFQNKLLQNKIFFVFSTAWRHYRLERNVFGCSAMESATNSATSAAADTIKQKALKGTFGKRNKYKKLFK